MLSLDGIFIGDLKSKFYNVLLILFPLVVNLGWDSPLNFMGILFLKNNVKRKKCASRAWWIPALVKSICLWKQILTKHLSFFVWGPHFLRRHFFWPPSKGSVYFKVFMSWSRGRVAANKTLLYFGHGNASPNIKYLFNIFTIIYRQSPIFSSVTKKLF